MASEDKIGIIGQEVGQENNGIAWQHSGYTPAYQQPQQTGTVMAASGQPVMMAYPAPITVAVPGGPAVAYPPQQQFQPVVAPGQGQVYYVMGNGAMNPVLIMNSGGQPYYNTTSQRCCGFKVMRAVQLAFSVALLASACGLMGVAGAYENYDWYDMEDRWAQNMWSIFPPLATIIATIVQLSCKNPVNPGCATPSQCRSVSDLVFAIIYSLETPLLASAAWLSVWVTYDAVAGIIACLVIANISSFTLCILYWVTFGNLACCGCCSCITVDNQV